jgi:hypothetical protein
MDTRDIARIAQLLVLDYPVSAACRELEIEELDFWEALVTRMSVSNGIAVAYAMGRDFAALDKQIPLRAAGDAYDAGSKKALESYRTELNFTEEIKSDLIRKIIDEAKSKEAIDES